MHEFEQIENAIIARLDALKASGLKTLEAYSGQMEVGELEELTFQFPCIYVIAGGLRIEEVNRYDKYRVDVTLMVGDRNVRGGVAAARGDVSSPGVYEMLKEARGLIHNKKLLEGWTRPLVTHEGPLVYAPERSICLYTAEYGLRAVK